MIEYVALSFTGPGADISLLGDRFHRYPLWTVLKDKTATRDRTSSNLASARYKARQKAEKIAAQLASVGPAQDVPVVRQPLTRCVCGRAKSAALKGCVRHPNQKHARSKP